MIGKAQMVEFLSTKTLRRVSDTHLKSFRGRKTRQGLMEALAVTVERKVLVDALDGEELRGLMSRVNCRGMAGLTDAELREALCGEYSSFRGEDGSGSLLLLKHVEALAETLDRRNCLVRLCVGAPASEKEVVAVEKRFALRFPRFMRELFLCVSGEFLFSWGVAGSPFSMPGQVDLESLSDDEVYGFAGVLSWSVSDLDALDVEGFCLNSDRVLPCFGDGEGNCLAFTRDGAVAWWSHDDDELHGRIVARSLEQLLEMWSSHYFIAPTPPVMRWLLAESNGSDGIPIDTAVSRRLAQVLE